MRRVGGVAWARRVSPVVTGSACSNAVRSPVSPAAASKMRAPAPSCHPGSDDGGWS